MHVSQKIEAVIGFDRQDVLEVATELMLFASQAVTEINMQVTACQGLGLSLNEFAPLAMPKPVSTPLT